MQDSEEEDNPESRHTTESLPPPLPDRAGLFSEHPFLRTLTGAVAGFAAGVVGLFEGGFHVYDLLAALLMIFATPVCVVLLTSCLGKPEKRCCSRRIRCMALPVRMFRPVGTGAC